MDLGYLMCSTLVCDPEKYSSHPVVDDEDIITASVGKIKIGTNKLHRNFGMEMSSSMDESCCLIPDHQSALSNISSLDVSSSSYAANKKRTVLVSGHTSPSSLALQRKLPDANHLFVQNHSLSIGSTVSSTNSVPSISDTTLSSSSNSSKTGNNGNNIHTSRKDNNNLTTVACADTSLSSKPFSHSQTVAINNETYFHTPSSRKNRKNDVMSSDRSSTSSKNRTNSSTFSSCTSSSTMNVSQEFLLDPSPLRINAWSEPLAESYHVRSKAYMTNRMKQPSAKTVFKLITVDLTNTDRPIYSGMCAHPEERVQKALRREHETGIRELPEFIFAINLCIPAQTTYHAVFYFGADKNCMNEIKQGQTPFGGMMKQFLYGSSDEYRDKTLKLIPRIVEGNYVVGKAVGSKPAILGKKIKQYYVRDDTGQDRYFEVIVDIASDPVAKRVTKLCLGYIKTIVVDLMFTLEGYDEFTLPEHIFGGARIKNLDFSMKDGKRTVVCPLTV